MANAFTYQVIKDTTEHTVIKLTGKFDGTGQEDNNRRITANTLSGAMDTSKANLLSSAANTGSLSFYGLAVNRLWYSGPNNADVNLFWHADTTASIFLLNSNCEFDGQSNWVTIPNNTKGTAGSKGDIGIQTRGMAANNSYTLILELRKDNQHYQRGHLTDPAAFNYGDYSIRP